MKVKTLASILGHPARAIAVASVLFVGGLPATPAAASDIGPSRFAVRNCTTTKILVCAYDRADRIMEIPYHARYVQPTKKERFSCNSADRCKVAMGMSEDTVKGLMNTGAIVPIGFSMLLGGMGGASIGAATVSIYLYTAPTIATAPIVAGAILGAAVVVGSVIAVTKFIDGVKVGDMCEKMMKDQKKIIRAIEDDDIRKLANDARKKQIQTRFPKYKNHTIKMDQGALVWEQGNDC